MFALIVLMVKAFNDVLKLFIQCSVLVIELQQTSIHACDEHFLVDILIARSVALCCSVSHLLLPWLWFKACSSPSLQTACVTGTADARAKFAMQLCAKWRANIM